MQTWPHFCLCYPELSIRPKFRDQEEGICLVDDFLLLCNLRHEQALWTQQFCLPQEKHNGAYAAEMLGEYKIAARGKNSINHGLTIAFHIHLVSPSVPDAVCRHTQVPSVSLQAT